MWSRRSCWCPSQRNVRRVSIINTEDSAAEGVWNGDGWVNIPQSSGPTGLQRGGTLGGGIPGQLDDNNGN